MMDTQLKRLRSVFAKNRAEELGYDVWEYFVVPPFYDRLDLHEARKPRVIIGGRGCGKTMLLRYLSHHSAFSPKRQFASAPDIDHIGLYWRADTQFGRLMTKRGVADDVWECAFGHLLALVLGIEVLESVGSIAHSHHDGLDASALQDFDYSALRGFGIELPAELASLLSALRRKLDEFETWVRNVRTSDIPRFLPDTKFVTRLIAITKAQCPALDSTVYLAFIDEYENLHEYQQRQINTWLKHSEPPLVFNIAMKRNGFRTTRTVGDESIVDMADYRTHDLDAYLLEGFPVFATEVLLLHLALAGIDPSPVTVERLRDPEKLGERQDAEYKDGVLRRAREIFPGISTSSMAITVMDDTALRRRLENRIRKALASRESKLPAERFIRAEFPEASVTTLALLNRPRLAIEDVEREFDLLERAEPNRFNGKTSWIHNNLFGCLLLLYASHSRPCPIYAGFDTFCALSHGNLRHFLELCHKSLNEAFQETGTNAMPVKLEHQARAARRASTAFLGEVRAFGRMGTQLHAFVLRVGSLFALSHQQPSQSEPERSHFAIVRGQQQLPPEARELLREAVKWSVLFEEEQTKVKDSMQAIDYEYVLNPIYSAYFNITYRKKRKLELPVEEFLVLVHGSYDEVATLLRKYFKRWRIELRDADPTLFSHMQEEGAS